MVTTVTVVRINLTVWMIVLAVNVTVPRSLTMFLVNMATRAKRMVMDLKMLVVQPNGIVKKIVSTEDVHNYSNLK